MSSKSPLRIQESNEELEEEKGDRERLKVEGGLGVGVGHEGQPQ